MFKQNKHDKTKDYALVIPGNSLAMLGADDASFSKIIEIGLYCKTVLGCRISPKQKGEILTMYRKVKPEKITLAIGDGANDVTMISLAQVGIGIKGLEGSEAARASDFAIGEFRNLKPLMYIHGRENYRRNSMLQIYVIYRNMHITIASQFWGFYNGFSGVPLFHELLISYFQLLYTTWGITSFTLTDREYSDKILMSEPKHYAIGMKNYYFSKKIFWAYEFYSIYQGMLPFLFQCIVIERSHSYESGQMTWYWVMANMTFFIMCVNINLMVLVYSHRITMATYITTFLGIGLFIATWAGLASSPISEIYATFEAMWEMPNYYWSSILVIVCALSPDYIFTRYLNLRKMKMIPSHKLSKIMGESTAAAKNGDPEIGRE